MIDWRQHLQVWRRAYGSVDACAGWSITTQFVHLAGLLPLFPRGSHLVQLGGEPGHEVPVTLGLKSVAIGYCRVWGPLVTLGLALALTRGGLADGGGWTGAAWIGAAILAAAASVAAWALGGLSVDARAQRLAYARHAQYPVDVARLPGVHDLVWSRLHPHVSKRAAELAAARHYPKTTSPEELWRDVAVDPLVTEAEFLSGALTLARIEWRLGSGAPRRRLADLHRAIWDNLRVADPTLLETAARA
ncbi:MAG: hypothetical protein IT373_38365 [Polyangiaceae bacterium]|nr:hypothetical protein [Polyangiaceae bacterium]